MMRQCGIMKVPAAKDHVGIIFSGWKPMNVDIDLDLQFKVQKKSFGRADEFMSFHSYSHEMLYS